MGQGRVQRRQWGRVQRGKCRFEVHGRTSQERTFQRSTAVSQAMGSEVGEGLANSDEEISTGVGVRAEGRDDVGRGRAGVAWVDLCGANEAARGMTLPLDDGAPIMARAQGQ